MLQAHDCPGSVRFSESAIGDVPTAMGRNLPGGGKRLRLADGPLVEFMYGQESGAEALAELRMTSPRNYLRGVLAAGNPSLISGTEPDYAFPPFVSPS